MFMLYTILTCIYIHYVYRSGDPVPQGQERLRQDAQRVRLQPRTQG